jgi:hypothetical protein
VLCVMRPACVMNCEGTEGAYDSNKPPTTTAKPLPGQVIRENPASRGTETSAEVLVGPPWRMVSNAGQQQWYGGYPCTLPYISSKPPRIQLPSSEVLTVTRPKKPYMVFSALHSTALSPLLSRAPLGFGRLLPGPGTLTHNDAHKTVQRIRKRKRSR